MLRKFNPQVLKSIVLAHRGLSGSYPENTMLAFQAALAGDHPAHGIELDIVFSQDDCPMVIHDETLDRTTNSTGLVESLSAAELQKLDAGSWFSEQYADATIPTLEEVLRGLGGSCLINIELKPKLGQQNKQFAEPERVSKEKLDKIIALLAEHGLFNSSVVSSFDHRILTDLRELSNLVNLAPIYDGLPSIDTAYQMANQLAAFSIHLNAQKVTEEWLSEWWGEWKGDDMWQGRTSSVKTPLVLCWTVDDPQQMMQLLKWGADGVFSNHSSRLIKHLKEVSNPATK